MARITKEEVLKIAHMSRIAIHEQEIEGLIAQLNQVLEYAARVNEVANPGPELVTKNTNIFRPDAVIPFDAALVKAQAPDVQEDYFVLPAILEHE